MENMNHFFAIK